jgi:radical SAM superfamily enzyme YgiQ (UPF0313 family)
MAPIGLLQIAAIADDLGHECVCVDLNDPNWLARAERYDPHVVAASVMTGEAKYYYAAAELIAEHIPNAVMIAGGVHPTFFPEMVKESKWHVICKGEGEAAFKTFLLDVERGCQLPEFKDIPNLITRTTPDPNNISIYPLQHDLDRLPPPMWELLYGRSGGTDMGKNPLKIYMTGRGCPYSCGYCFNKSWRDLYTGQRASALRKYSVDRVIADLMELKINYALEYVKFYDDVFVTKADDWFYEFCREYKTFIGKPFFVLMRAEHMTDVIARNLKKAGCQCVSMSIESKAEVRRLIMNREQKDEDLIEAHRICREHGLRTFTNVIVGLPDTTVIDDLEAMELAIKCRPDWIEYPIFEPYPRTELGEYTFSRGYADHDWRAVHTSYQHRSRLHYEGRHTKEREEQIKDIQENFGTIGVIATLFPRFHHWITSDLIHRKPNRLFLLWYFVVKMRRMQIMIYPTGLSWWGRMKVYYKSLKQELWRHSEE